MTAAYRDDLAFIHHAGFSEFAESAARGLLEILWRHEIREGLVIDVGCGSGVLARELTQTGFDVLGIDASPSMIAIARTVAPRARFEVGSFDAIDLPPCDAIVSMGEVLNYASLDAVSRLLTRARTRLIICDVAERGAYPPHDERRVEGEDWSVIAIKDSDGVRLTRRILTFRMRGGTMQRDEEVHTLELYERATLTALFRTYGYRVTVRRSYRTRRLPKGHAVYIAVRA